MTTVNIGIFAHVDAGKTSLTERLLFNAGVIDRLGRVDDGTTQTDSSELERSRGITIRAAVASFAAGDRTVNLIDTPGHPDFIAEVRRALTVLDGAVLVVSATSGVQAQTKILMRTLIRLRVPTLIFVNKIDRPGRDDILADIRQQLTPAAIAVTDPTGRALDRLDAAEILAEVDDAILAGYVTDSVTDDDLWRSLVSRTAKVAAHPVFFGSAVTGAGVPELVAGIGRFVPVAPVAGDSLRATVFQVERDPAGRRIALVRVHSGTLRVRAEIPVYRPGSAYRAKPVELRRGAEVVPSVTAGEIATVLGLGRVRIGDQLGSTDFPPQARTFPPPALASVVTARTPDERPKLFAALRELSDQDPLIRLAHNESTAELSVRLYGEVQQEVLESRLRNEFGVAAVFRPIEPVCVERPVGVGEAERRIDPRGANELFATVGLRVAPAEEGTGIDYRIAVQHGLLPRAFYGAIEETVHRAARRGPHGWQVVDCSVTLTAAGFASPISTAGDFRTLTELLFAEALRRAGTRVFEPVDRFELEVPEESVRAVLAELARLGALAHQDTTRDGIAVLLGTIPAGRTDRFRRRLPALTSGEGLFVTEPGGYAPLSR